MHLIYEEEGKYNFLYNSPQIIAQDIVMKLYSMLLEWLIDLQDEFIELKNNLNNIKDKRTIINNRFNRFNNDIIEEWDKKEKYFKIKKVIFYNIIIIINIFIYYYASSFCSIYKSTQKYLIKDFLNGQLTSLIFCLFSCFINSIIKIIFLKFKYGKSKKKLYNILKHWSILFILEIILEILVTIFYII